MSLYRNIVWYTRGLKQYTQKGYDAASKSFDPKDTEVNLNGLSFMITGANSGLGKCCASEIAKRGGTVLLVCRNRQRGEEAVKEIINDTKNENVHLLELDLANPQNIVQFASSFLASNKPLHVLINNAGCMINERQVNDAGLEANFATNTLGTYLLTELLLPKLKESSNSRVVVVSSGGMLVQKLDPVDLNFDKMNPFDGTMAYAQNKRQQVVMVEQWARQHPTVHFSAMHPGWADTPAVASSMPSFYEKMQGKLRTAEQGADTAVWLAISNAALKHPSGHFFQDRVPIATHLPLAWTKSSDADHQLLMTRLSELKNKFGSQ